MGAVRCSRPASRSVLALRRRPGRAAARRAGAIVGALLVALAAAPSVARAAPLGRPSELRSVSTQSERAERQAALELLAFVPMSYRGTCYIDEKPSLADFRDQIAVELGCVPSSGAARVFYTQFDDAAAMDAAFENYLPTDLGPGSPDECPATGEWVRGDTTVGRWACYLDDQTGLANMVWTDSANGILSGAIRGDDDLSALSEWWSTEDAGPLAVTVGSGSPVPVSDADWVANAQSLRDDYVPRVERRSCRVENLTPLSMGEDLYAVRMWLSTAITCDGTGVDYVRYVQYRPDVTLDGIQPLDGYMQASTVNVDEPSPRVKWDTLSCESSGTWSKRHRRVGEYTCVYAHSGKHDVAIMEWSEHYENVVGQAVREDGRAVPLLRFWQREAGPIYKSGEFAPQ